MSRGDKDDTADSSLLAWKGGLRTLWHTLKRYESIDGEQRAASFAYYSFFALFPLLLMLVSIGSYFFDPKHVTSALQEAVSRYMLVSEDRNDLVRQTIRGVIHARRGVGIFAAIGFLWSSMRVFQSLVRAVNRAWGSHEFSMWRVPRQTLIMIGILASALLVGVVAPALLSAYERSFRHAGVGPVVPAISMLFRLGQFMVRCGVFFYAFSVFYMLAPRKRVPFRRVWEASLLTTLLLQLLQSLFTLYTRNFANFNAVYGAFGGAIALLIWVYLSGSVIILGGCFCAVQAEEAGESPNRPVPLNPG